MKVAEHAFLKKKKKKRKKVNRIQAPQQGILAASGGFIHLEEQGCGGHTGRRVLQTPTVNSLWVPATMEPRDLSQLRAHTKALPGGN